jgi:hypothetical protein
VATDSRLLARRFPGALICVAIGFAGGGLESRGLATERGEVRLGLTLGVVRSLDFHDSEGTARRSKAVDAEGRRTDLPLDVARLALAVDWHLTRRIALEAELPIMRVAGHGPVAGRVGLGDALLGARYEIPSGRSLIAPYLRARVPSGEEAPGEPVEDGDDGEGVVAITGAGTADLLTGVELSRPLGPIRLDASIDLRYRVPGRVQWLSHPDAFNQPDLTAEWLPGHEAGGSVRLSFPAEGGLGVALGLRYVVRGEAAIRRARRVELLDDGGTELDVSDDIPRSILVGPEEVRLRGSDGSALTLTPALLLPWLGLSLEADLILRGRSTRYLHKQAPSSGGGADCRACYELGDLGREENAYWPLEPTGIRVFGDVLLGEVRLRAGF